MAWRAAMQASEPLHGSSNRTARGVGTIFVNDKKVAEGRIERTQPLVFSADEGVDVGEDRATPVVEDYGVPAPYKFTGTIDRVTIEIAAMKTAERSEEQRALSVAARQKALAD
jgi:hypothetical protein